MVKKLTVSLVIPCYNEEKVIKRCLKHVAAQDAAPDEVILVDNNCTDSTVRIAKQFPFVTVIKEKKQGLISARNRGFEFANGDILARIDADTRIGPDWVRTVRKNLSGSDLHGVTGPAKAIVEVHLPFVQSTFWSKLYFAYIKTQSGLDVLWGPNMAVKKGVYKKIKKELSKDSRKFHEDQDVSILMSKNELAIKNLPGLKVSIDGSRSADIRKIIEYERRHQRTFAYHYRAGNIQRKKLGLKDGLTLAAMAPFGLWAMLQGLMYVVEARLGLRKGR